MKAGSTAMTQRPRDRVPSGSMLVLPDPKKARQSKCTHKLLMIPFFDSTGMIYMHWVPTGQTVNTEYYVEVLREFRKRLLGKRPAFLKSGQWHFHQDNAPVLNSRLFVTDYLTKMGISIGFWITWILKKENSEIESFPPSADLPLDNIYIYIYIVLIFESYIFIYFYSSLLQIYYNGFWHYQVLFCILKSKQLYLLRNHFYGKQF